MLNSDFNKLIVNSHLLEDEFIEILKQHQTKTKYCLKLQGKDNKKGSFVCKCCGKDFHQKSNLTIHVKTCSSYKPEILLKRIELLEKENNNLLEEKKEWLEEKKEFLSRRMI